MFEYQGKSADTAKCTMPAVISYLAIPRKKLMRFRCSFAAGTDHKMDPKIVRFVSVPFPLVLMRRSIATNNTVSVISVNVIFGTECSTLCTAQTVVIGIVFSVILPGVFMGCISADFTDSCAVITMGYSFLFLTTTTDYTVILVVIPLTLPVMNMHMSATGNTGFCAVKCVFFKFCRIAPKAYEMMSVISYILNLPVMRMLCLRRYFRF